ncbi:MAG: carbohydrate ABC transporter permease [Bacteroides sp.]|nr:carbohydrate ABC transporter permease [Bacteroides sp.]
MGAKIRSNIAKFFLYAFLIILAVVCFLPFLMMLINATRSGSEIMTGFSLLPGGSLAENWKVVTDNMNLGRGFINSIILAVCNTLLVSYFSALTAYGLAFYKFKGAKVIFTVMLVFMMVPSQLSLLGFYDLCNNMRLIDSYIPLIVPSIASPATVFFLRQYILSVMPKAILEAPRIDGAGEIAIFHRIVLPIMAPGIATMAIGTFVGSWNSYLIPMLLINTPEKRPLPVMVADLSAVRDITTNLGATYLVVAISIVPIMIAFCFFSKYIISGISACRREKPC